MYLGKGHVNSRGYGGTMATICIIRDSDNDGGGDDDDG